MDKDYSSFFQTNEFQQALAQYEEMRNGGKAVYLDGDQFSDIAEYYASNDQYGQALETMDYALKLHPGDPELMAMKGSLLLETGNIDEARKTASQIAASTYNVLYLKAGILVKENNLQQAERLLQTMIHNEPDVDEDCFLDAAYLYMDNNYPHEAIRWFEKALQMNPWNTATQQDYAECCYRSNELERAIQWYNKALDENPYSTECWFGLAKSYSLKEDYAEAFNALDFVLAIEYGGKLYVSFIPIFSGMIFDLQHSGLICRDLEQTVQAIKHCAISKKPWNCRLARTTIPSTFSRTSHSATRKPGNWKKHWESLKQSSKTAMKTTRPPTS